MNDDKRNELVEKVVRACVDHPDFRFAILEALARPQVSLDFVMDHIKSLDSAPRI